jgi:hypothetical protein
MNASRNYRLVLSFAAVVCVSSLDQPASAISVELAKKCRELAVKAHPPAPPGSKTTSAKAQLEYYRSCVAKNGKMD